MKGKIFDYPLGFKGFDLQLFNDDDGSGQGGTAQQNSEPGFSGKFVEKVDPITKKSFKIPAELEPVLGHFISSTRQEIEGKYKPLIQQLEEEKSDLSGVRVEYEKLKESMMTAEEKARARAKQVIDEYEKKSKLHADEAQTWKQRFEKSTIKNDILSAFGDTKLCNPAQVAVLFEIEGNAKIREAVDKDGKPTGQFETVVTMLIENEKTKELEQVEGTPAEVFKKWIKMERNSHHIPSAFGGGGSGARNNNIAGNSSNEDLMKLPASERMKVFRASQGANK